MSCALSLLVDNTCIASISGLTNAAGAFVNDADVTLSIATQADVPVTGETWPKAMGYVTGSDGAYEATLSHLLGIVADVAYRVTIRAEAPDGSVYQSTHLVTAQTRGC